jgi:hypothetical protein
MADPAHYGPTPPMTPPKISPILLNLTARLTFSDGLADGSEMRIVNVCKRLTA